MSIQFFLQFLYALNQPLDVIYRRVRVMIPTFLGQPPGFDFF